jgi:1-acyl-sn-glycerol-3-phosphate acyltransferase
MLFRSVLFNFVFYANLTTFLLVGSPLLLAPRRWAMWALKLWATTSLWWLQVIVGIRLEVRGLGHVPPGAVLIAAKHQSLFETFAVLPLLADPAMVLKRELLWIPLFGWFAVKFRMLPVARAAGATALKTLIGRAKAAARAGRQVLIFPEGTRRPPGALPAYRPGAAALYLNTGMPCVPLALNSGIYWPRRSLKLSPGTIIFEFLPVIPPGLDRAEFSRRLQNAIETASTALLVEGRRSGQVDPGSTQPHNCRQTDAGENTS